MEEVCDGTGTKFVGMVVVESYVQAKVFVERIKSRIRTADGAITVRQTVRLGSSIGSL